jgi:hypothetical protein
VVSNDDHRRKEEVLGRSHRIPFDPRIKNLLVIAGLSGCGKSTFIRQLLRRRLQPDVMEALPADIHNWQHAFGRSRRIVPRFRNRSRKCSGQIFHYDITTSTAYLRSLGEVCEQHREEELLHDILDAAENVRIVVIKPPKEQLIRQLSSRAAVVHLPAPLRPLASRAGPLMLNLEKRIPAGLKSTTGRLGLRWAERSRVRDYNFRNCEFYSRDGAIESVHVDWERSICRQIGRKLSGPLTYVEPAPNGFGRRHFRLAGAYAEQRTGLKPVKTSYTKLHRFAETLDSAMTVPGTSFKVGLDPLIGILPIVGDVVSGSMGAYIIWKAAKLGAPRRLVGRMAMNSTLDVVLGCIPLAGDIFDAAHKSNLQNVGMLRRHLLATELFPNASLP